MKITVTVQDEVLQLSRTLDPDKPDDWIDQIEIQIAAILRAKAALETPQKPAATPQPVKRGNHCAVCGGPIGAVFFGDRSLGACCSEACARKLLDSSPTIPTASPFPSPPHRSE